MANPTAVKDTNTIYFNDADGVTGNVLANDIAANPGDTLTLRFLDGERVADNGKGGDNIVDGQYGRFTIYNDGSYTYKLFSTTTMPTDGSSLIEKVSYKVANQSGQTDFDYLTITIQPASQKPIAVDDFDVVVANRADGNILLNDIDPDGGTLQVSRVGGTNEATANPNDFILQFIQPGEGDTVVEGKYGFLAVDRDGNYEYFLNSGDADTIALRAADGTAVEKFQYRMYDDEFGTGAPNADTTDVGILHITINDI